MHDLGGDVSFPFVNYDGPKLTHDTSIRRLIRRQAMRDVAAIRKQRGGYGQQNLRQYPVFLEQVTNADDSSLQVKIPVQSVISICAHSNTPSDQDRSGSFEQLKENRVASCRRGFLLPTPIVHSDLVMAQKFSLLLNHTPLTGLRLGIAKFSLPDFEYTDETDDLFTTHAGSRKLLYSIPSRYGKVSSVSHATDCVVARLSQMMQFPQKRTKDSEATALLHYTKALRALQAALADDIQRMAPETLCATVLLGIFELLDGKPDPHSWIRHASGAARLIETRGANRFTTEFEMALFIAHIGPTVMDAFLSNKSCFLAETQWKQVMLSAVCSDEALAEQKELVLGLWSHLVDGPKKFKQTTDLVCSTTSPPEKAVNDLMESLMQDRNSLIFWMSSAQRRYGFQERQFRECKYGVFFPPPISKLGKPSTQQATQLALWGTYVMCRILKARLLYALAPSRFEFLEAECQDLAGRIMALTLNPTEDRSEKLMENLFNSQSTWIAKGVLKTKEIWGDYRECQKGMIAKWKFEAWCKAIGRKPTC